MSPKPELIDYASNQTPVSPIRRPIDWLRFSPFFAVLCAIFAFLKSTQYHDVGQLRDAEQHPTLLFAILSLICLILAFARFARYRNAGRAKLVEAVLFFILLCAIVLVCDGLALWNLKTAPYTANQSFFW